MEILIVIILFLTGEDYYFISQKKRKRGFFYQMAPVAEFFLWIVTYSVKMYVPNFSSQWALFSSLFSNCPKYTVCSSKFCARIVSFGTLNHCHKVPEYLIRGESKFSKGKINSSKNKPPSSLYQMSIAWDFHCLNS